MVWIRDVVDNFYFLSGWVGGFYGFYVFKKRAEKIVKKIGEIIRVEGNRKT